jgi:hypothetical protein
MTDNNKLGAILRHAKAYVNDHMSQFDPNDPGLFWGEALCDVLGGADYKAFAKVTSKEDLVISVLPVFGQPVDAQQFTIEQLGTVVAAAGEIHDVAPASTNGLEVGTENWILNFAVRTASGDEAGAAPLTGNPTGLEGVLFVTSFWLVNTPGGLLDLTGIKRPW